MFWSGNYIAVREVGKLLTEKNVTLTQMLEADDILQECKADNKMLMCYLTKPQILAELITLILEEPPKDVELSSQYRHASIASEVLTSDLSMLSNQLAMDVVQMNRICDFVNREPPLNPLLASYFSKTIGMLLEQSTKQGWCLYQIVCLRVLDIFKARRDFLPNLLRHMSTSAIADTFKYFIRLDYPFKEVIMEWFEEHQFLESLIQIICGTYEPPQLQGGEAPAPPPPPPPPAEPAPPVPPAPLDNRRDEAPQEKVDNCVVNAACSLDSANGNDEPEAEPGALRRWNEERAERERRQADQTAEEARQTRARAARLRAVAADNAAELVCGLLANAAGLACEYETMGSWNSSKRKAHAVVARLRGGDAVRALLAGVFTASGARRRHALAAGARVLLALLRHEPAPEQMSEAERAEWPEWACAASVERAVAPHIPLLHHALLRDPALDDDEDDDDEGGERRAPPPPPHQIAEGAGEGSSNGEAAAGDGDRGSAGGEKRTARVGAARLGAAALLAQLACSEVDDVPNALVSLGTAGVLAQLSFEHEHNNFLHAQMHALVRNALANRRHAQRYADHLINECNLLEQLMDLFEENEDRTRGRVRAGYMGHVVLMLRRFHELEPPERLDGLLEEPLRARWAQFRDARLRPLLERHDTPLSGVYPSETSYEVETAADTMASNYDIGEGGGVDGEDLEGIGGVSAPAAREAFEALAGEGDGDGDGEEGGEGEDWGRGHVIMDYIANMAAQHFQFREKDGYNGSSEEPGAAQGEAPPPAPPLYEPLLPWESAGGGAAAAGAGGAAGGACGGECGAECWGDCWANFADSFPQSPFDDPVPWAFGDFASPETTGAAEAAEAAEAGSAAGGGVAGGMERMRLADGEDGEGDEGDAASSELAHNLRAAMSSMTPDAVANIVNANLALDAER